MKKKKRIKKLLYALLAFIVMGVGIITNQTKTSTNSNPTFHGVSYSVINVEGGDRSGNRQSNVAVNVGFGDRTYWAFTNEYGQLIGVTAEQIIIQDDKVEPVNSAGRYYDEEADVLGTERSDLDQGHIIADSLGGVANAYNITPQNSTLNRHGDQAYMEKVIRDAGGCKDFVATITYPDTKTQIPSRYRYEYVVNGTKVVDEFDNKNPELETYENDMQETTISSEGNSNKKNIDNIVNMETNDMEIQDTEISNNETNEQLAAIDIDGNGTVTVGEAKAAGCQMPIASTHWLYPYMYDGDGDGFVGE